MFYKSYCYNIHTAAYILPAVDSCLASDLMEPTQDQIRLLPS